MAILIPLVNDLNVKQLHFCFKLSLNCKEECKVGAQVLQMASLTATPSRCPVVMEGQIEGEFAQMCSHQIGG